MQITDFMVDIEAIGPSPTGVITQIAMVPFNRDGEYGLDTALSMPVSIQSNLDLGRTVDESTLSWWFKQSKEAIDLVMNAEGKLPLSKAIDQITSLLSTKDPKRKCGIWSHATYDFVMLQHASNVSCKQRQVFEYRNSRDIRELTALHYELTGKRKLDIPFEGTKHNAIDDCVHQIRYCTVMRNKLLAAKEAG